jgi:hypothetical protein
MIRLESLSFIDVNRIAMTSAKDALIKLFWKNQHIGNIGNANWSDFPWRVGKFVPIQVSKEVHTVLEWFASIAEADELADPPFEEELINNWWIETPEGKRINLIGVPLIEFNEGTIELC